ncbi:Emopamil binding protein-domain-containing protein [Podospora aff. communis PSN243]|uniref:Emopamil binding protein-domain-containing protein n=1 Tax=Podospora aff. communis PSN243 TaxID=3040156 RepID=A0AAV9HAK4_9PEZI|nr:Emopamil binding protein-domain-containing protein [Podospora aff. communis PSN243]
MTTNSIPHPYYPPEVQLSGGYVPNELGLVPLISRFVGLIAVHLGTTLTIAHVFNKRLDGKEQLVFLWFMLCAFLHLFFEGYFITHHTSLASSQSLFSQLWKEYSLSDSRYLTSNPFMLCIETLTVFIWGPLCVLAAVLLVAEKRGLRHVAQIVLSVGHLYGVLLYYGTCAFEERYKGVGYSRPDALYYWGYYVGMNGLWVVVPTLLLLQSAREIHRRLREKKVESKTKSPYHWL